MKQTKLIFFIILGGMSIVVFQEKELSTHEDPKVGQGSVHLIALGRSQRPHITQRKGD